MATTEQVIYVDRFELHEGKLPGLRAYTAGLAEVARNEPGVVGFHWYADEDGTRGTAVIIFSDAAALDRYLQQASPRFAQAMELVRSADVELLGRPSDAAAELTRAYGGRIIGEIVGFAR